jgi:hypothetical protein
MGVSDFHHMQDAALIVFRFGVQPGILSLAKSYLAQPTLIREGGSSVARKVNANFMAFPAWGGRRSTVIIV